jgi:hypothetical protein
MAFADGTRVVVDLTGLKSVRRLDVPKEAAGIVIQSPHQGYYDVMFYPDLPHTELTLASWVPEHLLRPADGSRGGGTADK